MRVKHIDDPGKVAERAGQAVHLVDHSRIDPAGFDIGEQPLQSRPLQEVAPEMPPSSYISGRQIQPSCFWLRI